MGLLSFIALLLALVTSLATAQDAQANSWPVAEPASVGLSLTALTEIHEDVLAGQYGHVDSFLVARQGRIVFEQYYEHNYRDIYRREASQPGALVVNDPSEFTTTSTPGGTPTTVIPTYTACQSVTKSVVSAIIGIAVARGDFPDLDTPVLSFFDPKTVANVDSRKKRLTLRHLLTMSDGLQWNENVPYVDPLNSFVDMAKTHDWVQFTLDLPMEEDPGLRFNYNSGATLILGHIFNIATGTDIEEYALEHLFKPLGIETYFWDRTPTGLADTQEGLYLSTRDLAKITQLFLQQGQWDDREVIPKAWVSESLAPAYSADNQDKESYGHGWWSGLYTVKDARHRAYYSKGFGGQRPILLPELDMVIVLTGWNILPEKPFFHADEVIERVVAAIEDKNNYPTEYAPHIHRGLGFELAPAEAGGEQLALNFEPWHE